MFRGQIGFMATDCGAHLYPYMPNAHRQKLPLPKRLMSTRSRDQWIVAIVAIVQVCNMY